MKATKWEMFKVFFIAFVTSTKFKTLCWQMLNGVLGLLIVALADLDLPWVVVVIPFLNVITKYINQNYL
jgi:hypothetical protein